jgi:aminopeptidase-like protein
LTDLGDVLHAHVAALFPICRSITGPGLRETLRYIADHIPLRISEVPTGTKVLDWEVPPEWRVRGATLRTLDGRTLIDFRHNTLHLLQYSTPVDRVVPLRELQAHLHSLPEQPDLIPYRTSYYARNWGFCLADRERQALTDDAYHVEIDTSLEPGSLSYGECLLPGDSAQEVLISAHCCHPSLANDNLSSIAVAIELARALSQRPHRFSYRFLFAPGTIGAIAWLHFNRDARARIAHGLVLTCLGDPAPPSYKRSRKGTAPIDRYADYVLREAGNGDRIAPFAPTGYDERQFCSPGFDLPMGCLMRSPGGSFPEYHTSADTPAFVTGAALANSFSVIRQILDLVERDGSFRNTSPLGEPQLGRRGLYDGERAAGLNRMAVDAQSVGRHAVAARHRRTCRIAVHRHRRRRRRVARGGSAGARGCPAGQVFWRGRSVRLVISAVAGKRYSIITTSATSDGWSRRSGV